MLIALAVLVAVWAAAWAGFRIAGSQKMTAEKFTAFASGLDLAKLNATQRAKALRELADKLNHLPMEDRRRARMDRGDCRIFFHISDV